MPARTIAIDLDDTLNNFTETLRSAYFAREESDRISQEAFDAYMLRLRSGEKDESELLSTEYSFFKYRIHQRCYQRAAAREDGIAFMRWLRANGWRIVICTHRDLRRANACTRLWLEENGIPFDHLFMAWNKIVFCRLWGIGHLVDDDPFNIRYGAPHGVNVYYPMMDRHGPQEAGGARGFRSFDEVRLWIEG